MRSIAPAAVERHSPSQKFRYPEISLAPSGKTVVHKALALTVRGPALMADESDVSSELSKIARLNGDFRRNYGTLLGAFLYLRSISAVRSRSWIWGGFLVAGFAAGLTWLQKQILLWLFST